MFREVIKAGSIGIEPSTEGRSSQEEWPEKNDLKPSFMRAMSVCVHMLESTSPYTSALRLPDSGWQRSMRSMTKIAQMLMQLGT